MKTTEDIITIARKLAEGETINTEEIAGYEHYLITWLETIADKLQAQARKLDDQAGNCDVVVGQLKEIIRNGTAYSNKRI
jgi:hypothetical protein